MGLILPPEWACCQQLETLGDSLAAVSRTTWQRSRDGQELEARQSGLESMVRRIGQAVDKAPLFGIIFWSDTGEHGFYVRSCGHYDGEKNDKR